MQARSPQKLKEESMPRTRIFGVLGVLVLLAGCAGMNDTQQRAATGTVGGAAVGAVLGAIGGNAGLGAIAGAGAGLVGGLVVDHAKKQEQSAYDQGYSAGRSTSPYR
jgi:membrane associated rhomboid family serine protease